MHRKKTDRAFCAAIVLTAVAATRAFAGGQVPIHRVAEVGDPAPGFPGMLFEGFGNLPVHEPFGDPPPRIGRDGTVTFHAHIGDDGIPNEEPPFGPRAVYRTAGGVPDLVVASGDPAPGTGSLFQGFAGTPEFPLGVTPEVQLGRLAFHGATFDEPMINMLYSDRFGPLELVLRDLDVLPGPPPNVVTLFAPAFRGQTVVVNALTSSAQEQKEGLWRDRTGAFEVIATDGVQAPGTEPGVLFGEGTELAFFGSVDGWDANAHGDVVFNGYLGIETAECGNGVCELAAGEDCLSCPGDCNGVQTGNPAERFCCGDGDGENPAGCGDPRCSQSGFACDDVVPPQITVNNDEGVWAHGPGGLELVVREGDPAPQAGPGVLYGSGANGASGGLATFGHNEIPPRNNDEGALLFGARITNADYYFKSSIWSTRTGEPELIVTGSSGLPQEPNGPLNEFPGDPAPGLEAFNATFSQFIFGDLSNTGHVAFIGGAIFNDNPLEGTVGIWWDRPGPLTFVAAIGQPVPGFPGATFQSVLYKVNTFNDWNHLLFFGEFGGFGGDGNRPLFRADPEGEVSVVLAPGGQVLIDGDELRTVASFVMGDGQSIAGERVFEMDFTDGSSGIFTAQVVPSSGNPFDLDGDGEVGIGDFLLLLGSWGACPAPCPPSCVGDYDGDCAVGITDFLTLLGNWGP